MNAAVGAPSIVRKKIICHNPVGFPPKVAKKRLAPRLEALDGKTSIAPYWRVVKDDGSLNPKFPGGVERQARRLRAEGLPVLKDRVTERNHTMLSRVPSSA